MGRKRKNKRLAPILWIILLIFLVYNPVSVRIMAVTAAAAHGVDTVIFYSLIAAESSFNSFAYSGKRAIGLGQVLPTTARYIYRYYLPGILFFPPANLHISAKYYRYLLDKYGGNHSLSLAAYNWGEGNVDRKLREESIFISPDADYRVLFRGVPETYHYIYRILDGK